MRADSADEPGARAPLVAQLTLHASVSTVRRNGCDARNNRETTHHGDRPSAAIATASCPRHACPSHACPSHAWARHAGPRGACRGEAGMNIGASDAPLPDVAPQDRFGLRQAAFWLDRAI